MTDVQSEYLFDYGEQEHDRLVAQSEVLDPYTRDLLVDAGLGPGARVLDLGSGAGNVALLAAELVGPQGHVVGIDRDPDSVHMAQRHAEKAGFRNVEFRVGDVQTLEGVEGGFDAVIGRVVLMYLADPVAAVRSAAERVRPGGLVCFHEADLTYTWCSPPTPLWTRMYECLHQTLSRGGIEARMGHRLHATYRAAGLPTPRLSMGTAVWGDPDGSGYSWPDVVLGVLPMMERLGVATAAEIGPGTLRRRMADELRDADAITIAGLMFGAWTRRPAGCGGTRHPAA